MAYPALSPKRPTARSPLTLSSSLPVLQCPVVPATLRDDIDVFQVHASRYLNPDQLPSGAVLVIGSGASGSQIAEELLRAGRRVYLSVGRHSRCRAIRDAI